MAVMELKDENTFPDEKVLKTILGNSFSSYSRLTELFHTNGMTFEWRYYRDGKAWLCKVQKKRRTIIWMSAWTGFLKATIYFSLKDLEKVYKIDIIEEVKDKIKETKDVGKSRPCIFEIRDEAILTDFEKVMQLKIGIT